MNNPKKIVCLHESSKSLTEQEIRRMNRHPGSRLAGARSLNGFKIRKHLCEHLAQTNKPISYKRMGALERNETEPTLAEINILCDELGMSADWYLREGYTPKACTLAMRPGNMTTLSQMIVELALQQQRLLDCPDDIS